MAGRNCQINILQIRRFAAITESNPLKPNLLGEPWDGDSLRAINGIGRLLVLSVQNKDYAVVQAIALLITAAFLVISLAVDLLYGVIDPRVRLVRRGAR